MKAFGSSSNLLGRDRNPRYKSVLKGEATAKNNGTSQSEAESISRSDQSHVESDSPPNGLGKTERNESPNRIQPWNWTIGWKTPTFMISIYILGTFKYQFNITSKAANTTKSIVDCDRAFLFLPLSEWQTRR